MDRYNGILPNVEEIIYSEQVNVVILAQPHMPYHFLLVTITTELVITRGKA
jgi:hypothetical protein